MTPTEVHISDPDGVLDLDQELELQRWVGDGFGMVVAVAAVYAPGRVDWRMGPVSGRWCGTPAYLVDSVYLPSPFPLVRSWPEGLRR